MGEYTGPSPLSDADPTAGIADGYKNPVLRFTTNPIPVGGYQAPSGFTPIVRLPVRGFTWFTVRVASVPAAVTGLTKLVAPTIYRIRCIASNQPETMVIGHIGSQYAIGVHQFSRACDSIIVDACATVPSAGGAQIQSTQLQVSIEGTP